MTVGVFEKREIAAEGPEMPVFGDVPVADPMTYTTYIQVTFQPQPEPFRGRPVVSKLPADWPYPPEGGYE